MTGPTIAQVAEKRLRDLLDQNGLPQPDEVEYWTASVVFVWHDTKTAVVVDLTETPSSDDESDAA